MNPTPSVADSWLGLLLGGSVTLAIIAWLFVVSRGRIADDTSRQQTIELLKQQLRDSDERMRVERERADKFAAERNDALADLKAWQGSVEHLTKQMQTQSVQIEALTRKVETTSAELQRATEELRIERQMSQRKEQYIHSLLREIHKFTSSYPADAHKLAVPDYPHMEEA